MIVVAARDASPGNRAGADIICDGKTDVGVLAKALSVPDREVVLTAGTFDANVGFNSAGNRYLRPAEGVTVRGAGPGVAARDHRTAGVCRRALSFRGPEVVTGLRLRDDGESDREPDLVEVHPPSHGKVDLGEVTVERSPPAPLPESERSTLIRA